MPLLELTALDYIDQLQATEDPDEVRGLFEAKLVQLGITNFALVEYSRIKSTFQKGIIEDRMPEGWKRRYLDQRYYERDPIIIEALQNLEPFLWSEVLAKCRDDKKQRRLFEEASEFKLNEGVSIPIFGPKGYAALMTLAGEHIEVTPRLRVLIHMMALYTHHHLVRLVRTAPKPKNPDARPLTPREIECLHWARIGKTDWEIGEILKISETVAHEYMENVKRKLGVASRVQAVYEALTSGLIHA